MLGPVMMRSRWSGPPSSTSLGMNPPGRSCRSSTGWRPSLMMSVSSLVSSGRQYPPSAATSARAASASASASVRRTNHPQDLAAPLVLFTKELRQDTVVDRPLARHFGRHEPELVRAVRAAEKSFDVHEDTFAAVLRGADDERIAAADAPRLGDDQVVLARPDDHAVHA